MMFSASLASACDRVLHLFSILLCGFAGDVAGDWAASVLLASTLYPITLATVPYAARYVGVHVRKAWNS